MEQFLGLVMIGKRDAYNKAANLIVACVFWINVSVKKEAASEGNQT